MKRHTNNQHQTARPAKAAKQGKEEDSSPSPHNALTEGVADVNGELLSRDEVFLDTATIPPTLPFPRPCFPWALPNTVSYLDSSCSTAMKATIGMPSQFVPPGQERTTPKKTAHEKNKRRYSLEEKRTLVDLWIKIQPEDAKHGWTRLKAYFDKATKTNNRSLRALSKAFEAIQNSKDEDLAQLRKEIEQKELETFKKKQALTSVAGRVGSIYPSCGEAKNSGEMKGDEDPEEDEKENDNPLVLTNRIKRQKRLDAFKRSKEESERRKEGIYDMGQTLNTALKFLVANRTGLHGEVERLKISQKKVREDLKEVHTDLKEVRNDVGKILELLEKKGESEKK
jgi:hypothetical protein